MTISVLVGHETNSAQIMISHAVGAILCPVIKGGDLRGDLVDLPRVVRLAHHRAPKAAPHAVARWIVPAPRPARVGEERHPRAPSRRLEVAPAVVAAVAHYGTVSGLGIAVAVPVVGAAAGVVGALVVPGSLR